MHALKRSICAFACLVVSSSLCAAAVALYELYQHGPAFYNAAHVLGGVLFYDFFTILLSLPGLLPMLWIVWRWKNLRGWRLWLFLILGSSSGPFSLIVFVILEQFRVPDIGGWGSIAAPALLWALCVSTLTTLIYLGVSKPLRLYETVH
jgi:hypothetical protein